MITQLNPEHYGFIKDDPVRPHISHSWRLRYPREVYALYEDKYAQYDEVLTEDPQAILCVAYCDRVPVCEKDLQHTGNSVAVFYTVWSYSKGAGRTIVNGAAEIIKHKHAPQRFVTLSPNTDMAERFHLSNGAEFLAKHEDCQNFEYHLWNSTVDI